MEGRDKSSTETKLRRRRAGTRKQKAWPAFGSGTRDQTAMTLHVPQIAGARMQHAGADQAETLLSHERVSCMCDKNRGLPFALHKRRLAQVLAARAAMGQVAQRPPRPATSRGIYLERSGRCTYLPPRRRRLLGAREAKAQPCAKKRHRRQAGSARAARPGVTARWRPHDGHRTPHKLFWLPLAQGALIRGNRRRGRRLVGTHPSRSTCLYLAWHRGWAKRGVAGGADAQMKQSFHDPWMLLVCCAACVAACSCAGPRWRNNQAWQMSGVVDLLCPRARPSFKLHARSTPSNSLSKILPAFSAAQPASAQRAFALIGALLLPAEVSVTPTSHSLISRRR